LAEFILNTILMTLRYIYSTSILTALLCFQSSMLSAQEKTDSIATSTMLSDTLLRINGRSIVTKIIATDSAKGIFYYLKPTNPNRFKKVTFDNTFSITNTTGEHLIYAQDTLGNDYTVPEMRYFILGEQDASKYKHPKLPFITNFIISGAAGLTGSFFAPIIPLVFTGILAIPKPKVKPTQVSSAMYLDEPTYISGYKYEAARKRRMNAVLGGGIGLVGGLVTSFILSSQGIDIY
jgi:hypothetical protein